MTNPPHPPAPRLTLQWIHFVLSCNVFRRLCLEHYLKTTLEKADHFRTVRLHIVLWITGLKLRVICITAFDFWWSHDQHKHNSERVSSAESLMVLLILTICPSANWVGARRSTQCLAMFLWVVIFGPLKLQPLGVCLHLIVLTFQGTLPLLVTSVL